MQIAAAMTVDRASDRIPFITCNAPPADRALESNGGDVEVVTLFALFHDSRRINEHRDHGHGTRGGEFARSLRGSPVHLDDTRIELLHTACEFHTDGG